MIYLLIVYLAVASALAARMAANVVANWRENPGEDPGAVVWCMLVGIALTWPAWATVVLLYGLGKEIRDLSSGILLVVVVQGQALLIPPAQPELLTLRAVAWGDSQSDVGRVFPAICRAMETERPDLVVGLGDYIQNATVPTEWAPLFLQPMGALLNVPRIACRGNHELPADFAALVCQIPVQQGVGQWAAVTVGRVRWLILDANDETLALRTSMDPGGVQRTWLQRELSSPEWAAAEHRAAIWHQPHATSMWYAPSCYYQSYALPRWREAMDMLAAAGCSLALQAHAHALQLGAWPTATSPMIWAISGGGGGALDGVCAPLPQLPVRGAWHHYLLIEFGPGGVVVQARRPDRSVIAEVRRP